MKKNLFNRVVLVLFMFMSLNSLAQINNNEFKIDLSPADLGMCGGINNSYDTVSIIAKKNGLSNFEIVFGLNNIPGLSFVPGSASIISQPGGYGIIEDLTNGVTIPKFLISNLSNWNLTDEVVFVFQRQADCDAVAYVQGGGIMKDEHTISYSDNGTLKVDGDVDHSISSYDLLYASLSIQALSTITTNVGETVIRPVNVIQGGLGNTNGFTHYVVIGSSIDNYVLSYNATPLTPSSINLDTLFYTIDLSTAPFTGNVGNGDAFFENGENVLFSESFETTDCYSTNIEHHAFWGCSLGENCQESSTEGFVVFSDEVPQISASLSAPNYGRFDMCGARTVTMTVTNNNSNAGAGAMDILLNLGLRHNTSPLSAYNSDSSVFNPMWAFDRLDTKRMSNFTYNCSGTSISIDTFAIPSTYYSWGSGVTIGALKDYFTTDPDGTGVGLDDLDGDGFFDDLVPGGSFEFCFDMEMNIRDLTCSSSAYGNYFSWEHVSVDVLHRNQCLAPVTTYRREINYSNIIRDYLLK